MKIHLTNGLEADIDEAEAERIAGWHAMKTIAGWHAMKTKTM